LTALHRALFVCVHTPLTSPSAPSNAVIVDPFFGSPEGLASGHKFFFKELQRPPFPFLFDVRPPFLFPPALDLNLLCAVDGVVDQNYCFLPLCPGAVFPPCQSQQLARLPEEETFFLPFSLNVPTKDGFYASLYFSF